MGPQGCLLGRGRNLPQPPPPSANLGPAAPASSETPSRRHARESPHPGIRGGAPCALWAQTPGVSTGCGVSLSSGWLKTCHTGGRRRGALQGTSPESPTLRECSRGRCDRPRARAPLQGEVFASSRASLAVGVRTQAPSLSATPWHPPVPSPSPRPGLSSPGTTSPQPGPNRRGPAPFCLLSPAPRLSRGALPRPAWHVGGARSGE